MRLPVPTASGTGRNTVSRGLIWALLLAVLLLFGLTQARATADLSFEFASGALTGPATFTVARLHDGTDVAEYESVNSSLLAAIASHGDEAKFIPDLMKSVDALGGTIVVSGGETDMYVDLQAGTYVVAAAAPTTNYAVDFADFSFNFPATVPAGNNLWKISNVGSQVHLSTIYKLLPGKAMDDLKAFLGSPGDAGGPPPFDTSDILDVEAVSPGQTVYIPLDLSGGNWVAVCFIQDLTPPHLPHFMEGMIQEFTVS